MQRLLRRALVALALLALAGWRFAVFVALAKADQAGAGPEVFVALGLFTLSVVAIVNRSQAWYERGSRRALVGEGRRA